MFLESNYYLPPNLIHKVVQRKKGRSLFTTCLLEMSDDWYNELDLGKFVGLVFIDLKKGFEIVDHDIIFSVKSSNSMAFSRESFLGLGLTYLAANNSVELTVLIQISEE